MSGIEGHKGSMMCTPARRRGRHTLEQRRQHIVIIPDIWVASWLNTRQSTYLVVTYSTESGNEVNFEALAAS
ncbi:hypothetical protein JR316_0002355 [Psilocybe cubensis]|uniref:Uncharacterized protein n=1 Tax=Psilocybe cubensis TaxID=181762 RepID=A0ACB8HCL4_PSICU|nr:hypothetical protein JR316_0002355 [Psilocybe cubensis]KAH9485447.1 hypothetical protein JR316_0002355 [Psilocybe cubensis]